jgi:glycosyltransferase involved in cell wall biosynthesis
VSAPVPPLRISLITPSFNQARFIGRTIDSVLSQTGDFQLEYRVVDGGSTDGTIDVLKSYGPRLQWVSEVDQGQVDAINKGLSAATGQVVGWLNSDDLLLPGGLARVAEAFTGHPGTEWVHGRCEIIDEQDRAVRRWVSRYKHFRARRHSFANLLTENYVSQMTAFWRRSVHEQIGYLDPRWRLAFDYDFFLRLASRGDPVYIQSPIACFRWYPTTKSGSALGRQFDESIAISARYDVSRGWTAARRQAKNAAFKGIYRLLAAARRWARPA